MARLVLRLLAILLAAGCGLDKREPVCWDVGVPHEESPSSAGLSSSELRADFASLNLAVDWEGQYADTLDWPTELQLQYSDFEPDRWYGGDAYCPAGSYVRGTLSISAGAVVSEGRSVGVLSMQPDALAWRVPWAVVSMEPIPVLEAEILADRDEGFTISGWELFLSSRDQDEFLVQVFVDGTEPSGAQTRVVAVRGSAVPSPP